MITLNNDWDEFLEAETNKPYYIELRKFLAAEFKAKTIYPSMYDIFNSLKYTPFENTNVVIIGQDPYINPGEAHGLAFSVQSGAKTPPSLKNIFIELKDDLGCFIPDNGCLIKWAEQGVLLLNTVLTVQAGRSKSHSGKGWEQFTSSVIKRLDDKETPIVFLLWGNDAKSKSLLIKNPRHKILTAAHPSPLAGGKFFRCKHFSKTNQFLLENNLPQIDWQIENRSC